MKAEADVMMFLATVKLYWSSWGISYPRKRQNVEKV